MPTEIRLSKLSSILIQKQEIELRGISMLLYAIAQCYEVFLTILSCNLQLVWKYSPLLKFNLIGVLIFLRNIIPLSSFVFSLNYKSFTSVFKLLIYLFIVCTNYDCLSMSFFTLVTSAHAFLPYFIPAFIIFLSLLKVFSISLREPFNVSIVASWSISFLSWAQFIFQILFTSLKSDDKLLVIFSKLSLSFSPLLFSNTISLACFQTQLRVSINCISLSISLLFTFIYSCYADVLAERAASCAVTTLTEVQSQ